MDNKDMYLFIGFFVPIRGKDDDFLCWLEVSKQEFLSLIEECNNFAQANNVQLRARKVHVDDCTFHHDFYLGDYIVGFVEYQLLDDDALGVIVNE